MTAGVHKTIKRSGNVAQLDITVNNKWDWDAGRELYIGNVPEGYRPTLERFGTGVTKGKITFGYSIYSDGAIRFWPNEKISSGDEICLNTTWII